MIDCIGIVKKQDIGKKNTQDGFPEEKKQRGKRKVDIVQKKCMRDERERDRHKQS